MPDQPTHWRTAKGEEIPFNQLTDEHLQKAYLYAGQRADHHYAKVEVFGSLQSELENEAARRGIVLLTKTELREAGIDINSKEVIRNSKSINPST